MTTIICEIGCNHQNNLDMAEHLVRAAWATGANVAKFQASTVNEEVSIRHAPDHYSELTKLVPTLEFLGRCAEMCRHVGIEFMCTPAGEESLDWVVKLGVQRIKIASDNLNNIAFLRAVARTHLPAVLSTGMGTLAEVSKASGLLSTLTQSPVLLHCVSAYPAELQDINLNQMLSLRKYGQVGLSDHTDSKLVPALAVAMGAVVIEKHITMDRTLPGPDHLASLEPEEFAMMVKYVRKAELALGPLQPKMVVDAERENLRLYRKSLVASRPVKAGETFTPDNVTAKRPGTGRPASDVDSVLGTKAARDYEQDEQL